MGQTRLYFRADKSAAEASYAEIERALEDDGMPVAISEVDEANAIFEVSVYAEESEEDVAARIAAILDAFGLAGQLAAETLPDIDWVTKSLEGLKPVRAGRFLVHGSHDRDSRRPGDLPIEIEAGQAFGTGHHGTTAGCLRMIERLVRRERPRNALDIGTGSAVLAIGLAKLARIPVLATDIDPVAVDVARENIRLNQAAAHVSAVTATGFAHNAIRRAAPFDLIVANILARPLMRLAPAMAQHIVPGGSLILSGILESQRDAVIAAYAGQSFRHVSTIPLEGWVTLHLKR